MTYNYSSNVAKYEICEDEFGICSVYKNDVFIDWYSKKDAEAIVKQMIKDDNRRKPK